MKLNCILKWVGFCFGRQSGTDSPVPCGRMNRASGRFPRDLNLPARPGVYRFRNKKSNTITYIGQTNNMRRRIAEHVSTGTLNLWTHYVEYKEARPRTSKEALCQAEKAHIRRHRPRDNKYRGGNGRR
jgi:hypothetical protein